MELEHVASNEPSTLNINISTTFHPNAVLSTSRYPTDPDTIFLSSDSVFFYVHQATILSVSENNFDGLLRDVGTDSPPEVRYQRENSGNQPMIISVKEHSKVLNIVLHLIYALPCERFRPTLSLLNDALPALKTFGICPQKVIGEGSEICNLLISFAPSQPLEVYALAAQLELHHVAVAASRFVLSISLSSVTEELACQMGPTYLRLLFFLHLGRTEALKRHLLTPPDTHEPNETCTAAEQKKLIRAWALATAYLAWDARADTSAITISGSLSPLLEHLTCFHCRENLSTRIRTLLQDWSLVKCTI
jgi:hypothetical protein